MKELDIKVGYNCNNACIFCLNKEKRHCKEFPLEDLKRQITKSAKGGCEKLIISGGEPLISRYFFKLLKFTKQKGISFIEIQTNGRMLYYESILKEISRFRPISFLVSLHFPDSKLYKTYCHSDGFHQVIRGIKHLVRHNFSFTTNTVIMKPNISLLKDIAKLLKKIGVLSMQYRFIDGRNVLEKYKEFVPQYKEVVPVVKEIIEENSDVNICFKEIPICVLGEDFESYLSPPLNPQRLNLSIKNKVYTSIEIDSYQFVFPNCENCLYRSVCRGIRKEYYQIYGYKEISPIIKIK